MKCKDFQAWLLTEECATESLPEDAARHIETCPECRCLYLLDTELENTIRSSFSPVEIPEGLLNKIESKLDRSGW